ncbi:hypothetical protein G6F70_004451 [Rhizopus microsporus]|nr:hypothetical protein G6F71_004515 [Rhizopus microsporus]KAG1199959.1 hypothetical protein G6F70_004451 [Rhizopus microsporus]KAG1211950.1 hypothetical protein G6F69_004130 [Rhizopus microsporus]KAG1235210.1 hypothetical protein G6F67_002948 [Rhizopus microsporus]KAG1260406.1 hypothetical protein G6F68_007459 [Rhizopus microsporus]
MLANSLNQPQLVEAIDVYAEDSSDKAVTDNDENDNLLDAETSEVAQDFVAIVEGEDEVATRPGKFEWQRSLAFPTQKEA